MAEIATITDLRTLLGDTDTENEIWSNAQLGLFIDLGYGEYTYGKRTEADGGTADDRVQAIKLAKVQAYEELHRDTSLFFKWKTQQKEVDRTMTPETCRLMAKDIWMQVHAHRKSLEAQIGDPDTKRAQGTNMQFGDPGRPNVRGWY